MLGVTIVAVGGTALSACGGVHESPRPAGNLTLEQARRFAEFPLYYAGDRVDGLPLVAVLRRNDTANYVSFVYGDCTGGGLEQGCAPPAEIQVWSPGARNLGSYESSAPGTPVPERAAIRSLPAAFLGPGQLELYAARSTVVIFSDSRERALAIANALRCLTGTNVAEAGSSEPVGTLDC